MTYGRPFPTTDILPDKEVNKGFSPSCESINKHQEIFIPRAKIFIYMGAFGQNLNANLPLHMSLDIELAWIMKWGLDGSVGYSGHRSQVSITCLTVLLIPFIVKAFASLQ